ncbi:DNA alkylation repair protein [Erysipelothrix sp. HDW6C]|uniref:DNA alkylation repair protein n=1 Tax=Erysipelothrix sp. HDW6C TaxID=2714930 RepID=UPI00140D9489|nr:DNA alkylation repair protein [Erysipelothrix sp. HDW6C]QIK70105.1 DNA alkylation repair protein [Erysipelothrix sp. HDW6C]
MTANIEATIREVSDAVVIVNNGFKPMKDVAQDLLDEHNHEFIAFLADALYASEHHQVRMVAVFLYGSLANESETVLRYLKEVVSQDVNWRVQEILAMAFDQFCSDRTYVLAIPTIEEWLNSNIANVRRAVTEGLRVWTSRPYFKDNPQIAVAYLSKMRSDSSEYVRKSVGNALRDISKKHAELIISEVRTWDLTDESVRHVYKHVNRNNLIA